MNEKKKSPIRKRIFEIVELDAGKDALSRAFDILIAALIVLCIVLTFLETFPHLSYLKPVFSKIEFVIIFVFLIEYIARLITADFLYQDVAPKKAVLKFVFSPTAIIDLLIIISYFAPVFFPTGIVVLRLLRVVRILRIFKYSSKYDAFNAIKDVLYEKKDQIFSSMVLIFILMIAASMLMYSLEHEAQPETFSNGFSGIWWAVSAMLTVGYGDIYPITTGGQIVAILIAFLGVGLVAVPTGIISAGFVEYYTKISRGIASNKNDDFMTMDIDEASPYIGETVFSIDVPKGIYISLIIRGDDFIVPQQNTKIRAGDCLVIASESARHIDSCIDEVCITGDKNSFVGKRLCDIDISRLQYVIMVKRNGKSLRPENNMILKDNDILVILDKRS